MTDTFRTAYRTSAAGSLREASAGTDARLVGWVHRIRDLGHLVFVDLRDRAGIVQVSFDPSWTPDAVLSEARTLSPEDVIQVEGPVELRVKPNPELPSGAVEVRGTALTVIGRADPLPIQVAYAAGEELPAEDLRLRHRPLDLRRPDLQRNFIARHRAAHATRNYLSEQGFLEIETPLLTKRTPEGARDFVVPSRVHPGEFFALPQSPQIYKQVLMVSGFDRYYQIARCLRDEDLRADRQLEFTQIDAEMAFVDEEDVFRVGEGLMAAIFREVAGVELATPFPRITYAEAMARYGSDKPDLRYGLEIVDLTGVLKQADFRVFQGVEGTPQRIRGIRVPGGARLSRKETDELQDVAKRGGALGALVLKRTEEGFSGPFAKALAGDVLEGFLRETGMEVGDLFVAVVGFFRSAPSAEGSDPVAAGMEAALDELRRHLARKMELVDPSKHAWAWITEFPLFAWDADAGRLLPEHHPFTMPHPDDVPLVLEAAKDGRIDPAVARSLYRRPVRSRAYDAVYNGNEMASGSVRIHDPALQSAVFRAVGIGADEAKAKFGFLLEAFRYGAPPHAGFAFGFDRLVMLLVGAPSLREVIAFPKTTAARGLFEGAPSPMADEELRDVHVKALRPGS
jgi:aspartyl-tRNA synthetase